MAAMHGQVASKLIRAGKALGTVWPGASVGLLTSVGSHVGLEVIRAGELPLADVTLKGTDSSVLAAVTAKLVGSREPLSTVVHLTSIWLLTGVLANVHLQVGELHVAFGAPRVQADKGLAAFIIPLRDLLEWHRDNLRDKLLGSKAHWHLVGVVHGWKAGQHPLLLLRLVGRGEGGRVGVHHRFLS